MCLPPLLVDAYRKWARKGVRFVGAYPDWASARAASVGYDAQLILDRVSTAQDKVLRGEAAYERDSVTFDVVEYPFPLLAGLLRAANETGGALRVIDFGGALGSTYFQCRAFLDRLPMVHWHVVEQANFVEHGRARFESDRLRFVSTISASQEIMRPDVVLFCSVLQYIEDVAVRLQEAIDSGCAYIIIDRTPMSVLDDDALCVQHVPAEIYAASYPCAILSEARLRSLLDDHFELIAEFDALGGGGEVEGVKTAVPFFYKGMIWRKR